MKNVFCLTNHGIYLLLIFCAMSETGLLYRWQNSHEVDKVDFTRMFQFFLAAQMRGTGVYFDLGGGFCYLLPTTLFQP